MQYGWYISYLAGKYYIRTLHYKKVRYVFKDRTKAYAKLHILNYGARYITPIEINNYQNLKKMAETSLGREIYPHCPFSQIRK